MDNIRPDATAGELEEEVDFTDILILSLDNEAEDYESRREELIQQKDYLNHRLELVRSGKWDPTQADAHSSAIAPSAATSSKRPASTVVSDEERASKRLTPSPHPHPGSGSASRALDRQLRLEAAIRRSQQASSADEQYARQLQQNDMSAQSSSRPTWQSTLNQDGSFRPPVRQPPAVLSTVPQPVQVPPVKAESHLRRAPIVDRTRNTADTVDLTGDSDGEASAAKSRPSTTLNNVPSSYPYSTSRPPVQHQYARPPAYPQMPGAFPPSGPSTQWAGSPYQGASGPPWAGSQPFGYLQRPSPQQPNQNMTRVEQALNSFLAVGGRAQEAINSRFAELGGLIDPSRRMFGGHDYDEDDDDSDPDLVYAGERRLINPYNPYARHQDLYQSRFEQIEHYNPEKTREEINELLMNIRPDEELSDDLLVSTPSEMTIKLHKYQELGLTWLQKAEDGSNKGGILADDMGLGKTIQMISLIVTHKSQDPRNKTTLIVAPVALLRQWKQEIRDKVKPGRHALSVHIHHGAAKKTSFKDLQVFDVVLTTFGSLAAEVKRLEKFMLRKANDSNARPTKAEQCTLLDPDGRWYRVILDEAQCIKNKSTQTAKAACFLNATYRFCMTGTPMMNNVTELYSLIKFLRIKPYNSWEKFNLDIAGPLKRSREEERAPAMRKLQTLCRAIMLRRTKKSKYRGKPILVLPERTTEVDEAAFDQDEQAIYTALETQTQITFNRYLRAGTVGRSYSAILVLLLRLRQACCHPHLIKDFSISAAADLTDEQLVDLARELEPQVVARIRATEGNFECSICMDACTNPAIFLPCGHDTCRECYVKLADPQNGLQEGNENAVKARCPHCRGDIDPKRITDFVSFKRVHMPELLTDEEKKAFGLDAQQDGSETESEEDIESEDDETESEIDDGDTTLGGFIVDDDNSETESEAEEADAAEELSDNEGPSVRKSRAKKDKKSRKSKKAKGKEKVTAKKLTLAELKKMASRNAKAKKRYLRRLREDFKDSGKLRKMMELLCNIIETPDAEGSDEQDDDIKPKLSRANGEKILVFSQWTSLLDLCEIMIDEKGWDYRRYDGSMNAKSRGDAVDDFKDKSKDVRIMLVSLKAGNAGLNLNVASQVIIMDPFWNPYIEEQAIDRAHRIGQTRPVKVHRVLVPQTVEDRIMELQEKKRDLIEQALDERQASQLGRLGARELAYLFGITRNINEPVREGA